MHSLTYRVSILMTSRGDNMWLEYDIIVDLLAGERFTDLDDN